MEEGNMSDIYLDACNAQGAWGKGVALEFKKQVRSNPTQERGLGHSRCAGPFLRTLTAINSFHKPTTSTHSFARRNPRLNQHFWHTSSL